VKPNRPYSQIADLIVQLGKEKISRAQVVFKGRLVSAVPLPQPDLSNIQDFVLTYEVSAWKKGRGGSHAKLLNSVWCDGQCSSSEIIADFMRQIEERVYIADPVLDADTADARLKDLDGMVNICAYRDSMRPIGAELPRDEHLNHREFLFLLSVTEALENLPAQVP
jgi:hypothetical protein